jgi:hypothetical protein
MILGDSHVLTLVLGSEAAGRTPAVFTSSGANWHAGLIGYHPRRGLVGRRQAARFVAAFRARHGDADLTDGRVPVLASFGFHLGRLVPPFCLNGTRPTPEEALAGPDLLYASEGFVTAYTRHHRGALLTMLAQIARRAPIVNVAPPVPDRVGFARFKAVLLGLMAEAGVPTVDPQADLFDGRVPADLFEPDGIHGNGDYGRAVVAHLQELGHLP